MAGIRATIVIALAAAFALPAALTAEDFVGDEYSVSVQQDVTYAQAMVGVSGADQQWRDLKMDVYRPLMDGEPVQDRPAVILAFGGAFHRGTKGTTRFEEDGASDTPMGEYCQMLAAAGYVCMSIEYRLTPEDPAPPESLDAATLFPKAMLADPAATARVDLVRGRMGLPPLDDASRTQLWNAVLAATEDLGSAVGFARAKAGEFGLDPDRIAIGGFSAGAITAVNAAYGAAVPVKAVISLSGGVAGHDIRTTARAGMPEGLFILGQNDLAGMHLGTGLVLATLDEAGVATEAAWIPGFGHFYPMGAPSLGTDMTRMTLKRRVLRFLERVLSAEQ